MTRLFPRARGGVACTLIAAVLIAAAAGVALAAASRSRLPNLRLVQAATAARSALPGHSLRVSEIVRNDGTATGGHSTLSITLKPAKGHGRAVTLARWRVPALRRGRSWRATHSVRIPAAVSAGRYVLVSCADAQKRVRESRESDNCISARPPLVVSSVAAGSVASQGGPAAGPPVATAPAGPPADVPSPAPPPPPVDFTAPLVTLSHPSGPISNQTPTFDGTAGTAGGDSTTVNVDVYSGSTASGSVLMTLNATASGGLWSVTPSTNLAEGTYTAVARQSDAAGNVGQTPAKTFTVDTTPPTVSVTSPAAGSLTDDSTPQITGNASDSTPVTVKVYDGAAASGTPVQTLKVTPASGSWSATPATLGDGQYTVQAVQVDAAGNSGPSGTRTFSVDTARPVLALALTPASANGQNGWYTTMPRVHVTADDSDFSSLACQVDSANVSVSPTSGSSHSAEGDVPVSGDGSHSVSCTATDRAGNSTTQSTSFKVDSAAPLVTLTQPASGSTTNDTTPAFIGAAGTAAGDLSGVTVMVYAGTAASGTPVATLSATSAGGSWNASPASGLPDGTYTAQAEQQDSAGNTGRSAARTFTIDTGAPAVTLTQPASGSSTDDSTPAFSGSAGTAAGDSSSIVVEVYPGTSASGTPAVTLSATASAGRWTATPTFGLVDGTYTAQAEQQDSAGNTGRSAPRTLTIDTTAPLVSLSHPSGLTQNTTPTFDGSAGTASGDGNAVTVNVYSGSTATGTPVRTMNATASGGLWSVTPGTSFADGTYTAQATQADAAGNAGQSTAGTFTIDSTPPAIAVSSPASGSATNDKTPTISGSASETTQVTLKLYSGASATGTAAQTLTATPASGSWSVTAAALADGQYTVQATQQDAAGNTGQSSARTFSVDTAIPALALTLTPSAANGQNGWYTSMPQVHVTADDVTFSQLACRVDSAEVTVSSTPASSHSAEGDVPVSGDGSHGVSCTATDKAGNSNTQTTSFKVDSVAPSLEITSPTASSTTGDQTPSVSGTSSDAGTVTVKIYAGAGATGTPVQTLSASASSGTWSTSATGTLPVGPYTAVASQSDAAGNTGSASVTFSSPAVLLAAGDIASCTQTGDSETAALFATTPSDAVAALGDNAYESGSGTDYSNCYDPTWGAVKGKTHPAAGNHEYVTTGAAGYFGYFGSAAGDSGKGYYSYDLGSWHIVVLNSSDGCATLACSAGSAQEVWLKADLAAHPNTCTLAYWHQPLFTSDDDVGTTAAVKPFWDDLKAAGAELVLNGHAHMYERFTPQDPDGTADSANGITEIVSGTGGYTEHTGITPTTNSVVRNNDTFGLLKLTLRPGGYSWQFLPVAGKTFTDSGSAGCH